jgi:CheY-like chemotaxis protein
VPYTLLLADDSVTIQRVIELTFADEDVKVIAVSDGDQAIARVESSPPDIVLADIGMPGKNGYEVAKYIKQSPRLAHIPVVLLTGAFEPVDQARANDAGCDGVLAKPFEPQLVIGRVKDLLAKSAPPRTAAPPAAAAPAPAAAPTAPAPPPRSVAAGDAPLDQPAATTTGSPALDDYFDRLDAAFQTLPGSTSAAATPSGNAASDIDWFGKPDSSAPASEAWDLPAADSVPADVADLALSYESPQAAGATLGAPMENAPGASSDMDTTATARGAAAPVSHEARPAAIAAAAPPPSTPAAPAPPASPSPVASTTAAPSAPVQLPTIESLPPLAEAFAAILAAEQHDASEPAQWPGSSLSADALVEQVSRRVLDRLSERVVRDAVSDIVSQIAERLVREEIERIKSSVR